MSKCVPYHGGDYSPYNLLLLALTLACCATLPLAYAAGTTTTQTTGAKAALLVHGHVFSW